MTCEGPHNHYESLRREITELRTELDLISGGWEHRIEIRRKLDQELENVRGELGLIRGELGIVREQRNNLREERNSLRDELSKARERREQVVKLLDETRAQLTKTIDERESARDALGDSRALWRKCAGNLDEARARLIKADERLTKTGDELVEARNALIDARTRLRKQASRVDGTLLYDLILEACPAVLSDEAAHDIARSAVDELDRVRPGVEVFRRGDPNDPWRRRDTPSTTAEPVETPRTCGPCRVDETVSAPEPSVEINTTDTEVRYAVLTGPRPGEVAFVVTETDTLTDAARTAEHLPGTWVGRQVTTSGTWTPVTQRSRNGECFMICRYTTISLDGLAI